MMMISGEETTMDYKYSDYCTAFWIEEKGAHQVWTWDEINNQPLRKYKVENKDAARKLIKDYISNAPKGVICHDVSCW